MARLPLAITADSPPCVPTGASLPSMSASPRSTPTFTTRSFSALMSLKEPLGTEPLGQSTVDSICALTRLPRSMSTAATTTLLDAMPLCRETQPVA
ncbi:hypothetical protein D9M68_433280 [compost metagenome]